MPFHLDLRTVARHCLHLFWTETVTDKLWRNLKTQLFFFFVFFWAPKPKQARVTYGKHVKPGQISSGSHWCNLWPSCKGSLFIEGNLSLFILCVAATAQPVSQRRAQTPQWTYSHYFQILIKCCLCLEIAITSTFQLFCLFSSLGLLRRSIWTPANKALLDIILILSTLHIWVLTSVQQRKWEWHVTFDFDSKGPTVWHVLSIVEYVCFGDFLKGQKIWNLDLLKQEFLF